MKLGLKLVLKEQAMKGKQREEGSFQARERAKGDSRTV